VVEATAVAAEMAGYDARAILGAEALRHAAFA
jgi:hypothetical protein